MNTAATTQATGLEALFASREELAAQYPDLDAALWDLSGEEWFTNLKDRGLQDEQKLTVARELCLRGLAAVAANAGIEADDLVMAHALQLCPSGMILETLQAELERAKQLGRPTVEDIRASGIFADFASLNTSVCQPERKPRQERKAKSLPQELRDEWSDASFLEKGYKMIPNVLLDHGWRLGLDATEQLVLIHILRDRHHAPTNGELAQRVGLSLSQVRKIIASLEGRGLVQREARRQKKNPAVNRSNRINLAGLVQKLEAVYVEQEAV